jgi:hypothetical protein
MNKIFQRLSKKTVNQLRRELAHAHLIIALLSIALITLLSLGAVQQVSFDETMSAISVVLLTLVTIISLSISVTLYRKK